MAHSDRGFGGYRGRRTLTDILRLIAIILGVLVVLMLAALFFFQEYIVYTDDSWRLELPFLQEKEGDDPLPDPGEVNLVEGSSSSGPEEVEEPTQEQGVRALQLPVSSLLSGQAAGLLEEAGADALILEMKDQSGQLAWLSAQDTANRAEVNGDQKVNQALEAWTQGEVYTIARVCCFRDDSVPYYRNPIALRRGSYNWRDELGLRWMSPAHESSQAYVAALCGELAALGFDEIVLEHFTFPLQGNLENINQGENYDPARFTGELEKFLTQVQQALEPYGTKLSLRVGRDTLAGEEWSSGLSAPLMEGYAARLWVDGPAVTPSWEELMEQRGISGGAGRLVVISSWTQPGEQASPLPSLAPAQREAVIGEISRREAALSGRDTAWTE